MTERVRVHLEQVTSKAPHMRLDPPAFEQAARRHPELAARLEPSFGDDGQGLDGAAADSSILITQVKPDRSLADCTPDVRWVFTTSAGVERFLPLDWLPPGADFSNNSGTHIPKTREYAIMALTMLHLRMPTLATSQRERAWQQVFRPVIEGQTVTIVGFGALGTASAEAARLLGLTVRAVRRNPAPHELADRTFGPADLHAALDGADFLVIAAPLTRETRGMVDGAALDRLAPGAGVLNIGRGPILVTADLVERLDSGHLSGAILDVFDSEPLAEDEAIWRQPNLMVTPHMSSDDPTTYVQRSLDIFFRDLAHVLDGRPPLNRIDPELGY